MVRWKESILKIDFSRVASLKSRSRLFAKAEKLIKGDIDTKRDSYQISWNRKWVEPYQFFSCRRAHIFKQAPSDCSLAEARRERLSCRAVWTRSEFTKRLYINLGGGKVSSKKIIKMFALEMTYFYRVFYSHNLLAQMNFFDCAPFFSASFLLEKVRRIRRFDMLFSDFVSNQQKLWIVLSKHFRPIYRAFSCRNWNNWIRKRERESLNHTRASRQIMLAANLTTAFGIMKPAKLEITFPIHRRWL